MIRRPPRSTPYRSSAASDVYKRQGLHFSMLLTVLHLMGPVNSWTRSTLQYVINSVSTVTVLVLVLHLMGPVYILGPTSDYIINTLWAQ